MNTSASVASIRHHDRAGGQRDKFLTFCLGREEYGLPILVVREIIGVIDITPLPRTPAHVKGIINLRGKIIPVIDLRARFDLPPVAYTSNTCIIVVENTGAAGVVTQLGIVVDAVSEVLDIDQNSIEASPSFGVAIPQSYILGMGKLRERVIILLDINSVGSMRTSEDAAA